MSLNFINIFQMKIFQNLKNLIPEHINRIYMSVAQDGYYPFILIDFIKIDNYSNQLQEIYLLEFEISIFSRGESKKTLLKISDLVTGALSPNSLETAGYLVAGIKLNNLFFTEARDLIHNKLTMNYKAMIKNNLKSEVIKISNQFYDHRIGEDEMKNDDEENI